MENRANLQQPLDFGTEAVKPEALLNIAAPPPTGSVVHARLETALSSPTAKMGDRVEALITKPLVVSDHLILPEGSVIKGSVVQWRERDGWDAMDSCEFYFIK